MYTESSPFEKCPRLDKAFVLKYLISALTTELVTPNSRGRETTSSPQVTTTLKPCSSTTLYLRMPYPQNRQTQQDFTRISESVQQ